MGAGYHWRPARRYSVRARAEDRLETCCFLVLHRLCSSVCWLATLLFFIFLLGLCLLRLPVPQEPSVRAQSSGVTLLIWKHPFMRHHRLPDCLALYQISGCTLTDDRKAYREADAVIFHHREIATDKADLPLEPRPRAQKWIWMNYESPAHTPELWRFEGVFNLTLTYRTDSDIFLPYGYLIPRQRGTHPLQGSAHPLRAPPRSQLLRPLLVAWVISNWSESHERVAFYRQLRRYVQVDVFGRVGRPVPKDNGGGESVLQLLGRYQFYLALENSQFTDYITEKLWNAVRAGAIPVVLGPPRRNYETFLPPEAFIHVEDFPSVRGLARYLRLLRSEPVRLRRHLDWRSGYSVRQPAFWAEHFCTACRAVRRSRGQTDVVEGLTPWFYS